MSIKLSDLLSKPHQCSRAVSANTDALQVRILIEEQESTVYATFEKNNDFNLIVCLFQKMGFKIGSHAAPSRWRAGDDRAIASSGPQLSSVLPGEVTGSLQRNSSSTIPREEPSSFGPYRSDPVDQSNFGAQYLPPVPPSQSWQHSPVGVTPSQQSMLMHRQPPTMQPMPLLNPYHVFARPRYVSSPLRNPYSPQHTINSPTQLGPSTLNADSTSLGLPTATYNSPAGPRAFSPPEIPGWPNDEPSQRWDPVERVPVPKDPVPERNQRSYSGQKPSDFRRFMPPPRSLPFTKEAQKEDVAITKGTEAVEVAGPDEGPVVPRVSKKPRPAREKRKPANSRKTTNTPTRRSEKKSAAAQPVAESRTVKNRALGACRRGDLKVAKEPVELNDSDAALSTQVDLEPEAGEDLGPSQRPTTPPAQPTVQTRIPSLVEPEIVVLLADDAFFKEMNAQTGRLIDQLQEDIKRGLSKHACAQFYMEQIFKIRRDMCYAELKMPRQP